MINYHELVKRFLFGGPVKYQGQRCHVVAMNDLLHTVKLEHNGEIIPKSIKPEEVEKYDETEVSKQKGAADDQV